jgi:hypothetical protein
LIEERFYSPDKDDPSTPNAQVLYDITSIEPGEFKDSTVNIMTVVLELEVIIF